MIGKLMSVIAIGILSIWVAKVSAEERCYVYFDAPQKTFSISEGSHYFWSHKISPAYGAETELLDALRNFQALGTCLPVTDIDASVCTMSHRSNGEIILMAQANDYVLNDRLLFITQDSRRASELAEQLKGLGQCEQIQDVGVEPIGSPPPKHWR